ncbi:hypothetical protein BC829DRAFT_388625 [Chytridium lagenaria]|nr:hypothetical protein BC829DRAFT_388625 [Chytridium lagenaria]
MTMDPSSSSSSSSSSSTSGSSATTVTTFTTITTTATTVTATPSPSIQNMLPSVPSTSLSEISSKSITVDTNTSSSTLLSDIYMQPSTLVPTSALVSPHHPSILRAPSPLSFFHHNDKHVKPHNPLVPSSQPPSRTQSPLPALDFIPRISHYYEQWGDDDDEEDEEQDGFFSSPTPSSDEAESEDEKFQPRLPIPTTSTRAQRPPLLALSPITIPANRTSSPALPTGSAVTSPTEKPAIALSPFVSATLNPLSFLTSFLTPPASPTTVSAPSAPWFTSLSSAPIEQSKTATPPPVSAPVPPSAASAVEWGTFPQRGMTPPPLPNGQSSAVHDVSFPHGSALVAPIAIRNPRPTPPRPIPPRLRVVGGGSRTIFPPPEPTCDDYDNENEDELDYGDGDDDEHLAGSFDRHAQCKSSRPPSFPEICILCNHTGLPPLPPVSSSPAPPPLAPLSYKNSDAAEGTPKSAPPQMWNPFSFTSFTTTPQKEISRAPSPHPRAPSPLPRAPSPLHQHSTSAPTKPMLSLLPHPRRQASSMSLGSHFDKTPIDDDDVPTSPCTVNVSDVPLPPPAPSSSVLDPMAAIAALTWGFRNLSEAALEGGWQLLGRAWLGDGGRQWRFLLMRRLGWEMRRGKALEGDGGLVSRKHFRSYHDI